MQHLRNVLRSLCWGIYRYWMEKGTLETCYQPFPRSSLLYATQILARWFERFVGFFIILCCIGPLVEDLFDVISCYFPVDFTPVSLLVLFYCIKTRYFSLLMSQQQFPEKPLFRVLKNVYPLQQSLPRLCMLRLFHFAYDLWLTLVVLCSTFT